MCCCYSQVFKISDVFDNLELRAGLQEQLLLHRDEYMVIDSDSKDRSRSEGVREGVSEGVSGKAMLTLDESAELGLERTQSTRSDSSHVL
jgi:hypothetical protein